jgi:hypothetical protein
MEDNIETQETAGCGAFPVIGASFYGIAAILSMFIDWIIASDNMLEPLIGLFIGIPVLVLIIVATGGIAAFILGLVAFAMAISIVALGIIGVVAGAISGIIAGLCYLILKIIPIPGSQLLNYPLGALLGGMTGAAVLSSETVPITYAMEDTLVYVFAITGFLVAVVATSAGNMPVSDDEDENQSQGVAGAAVWRGVGGLVDKSLDVAKKSNDKW